MKALAPIALFAYNRPTHLKKTLTALTNNTIAGQSDLFIFCDNGPESENKNIEKVRKIAKNVKGFKSVNCIFSDQNKGLAKSIMEGVSEIISVHKKIIVLEDDLVTSPLFLEYMNSGLDKYENKNEVGAIQGFIYKLDSAPESFCLKWFSSWGWATWESTWNSINFDGEILYKTLKDNKKIFSFNIDGSKSFSRILKNQVLGNNDSWAIRMYASLFLENKLSIYPQASYVKHIGYDSGTHHASFTDKQNDLNGKIFANKVVGFENLLLKENKDMKMQLSFFYKKNRPSFIKKVEIKLADILKKKQ